jgi:hypothetical protein
MTRAPLNAGLRARSAPRSGGAHSLSAGFALHLTAGALTAVILAPLAWPGYVLSYDMVFAPHQALLWDVVAPSGGLPRAVPEDFVVSLLNVAIPGWLLQRVALVGIVYFAALGAGRLVPAQRLLPRIVAAVGYAWSPFLAERLLLGQWGLLLAYAALPWLVMGLLRIRAGERRGLALAVVAAAVCAVTPSGGVIAVLTTLVLTVRTRQRWVVLPVALLNAPWIATALTTAATGRSDPLGVVAFAARGENWGGPYLALAGGGGTWNAFTTPSSRASVAIPLVTLALLALAGYGLPVLRERWPARAVLWLAGISFVLAALGRLPGTATLLEWAVRELPGAGLLRDGQKFVIPYALALNVAAALGAERLAARLNPVRGRLILATLVALPVIAMPDLAFGALGTLRPVSYPDDWDRVAAIVARDPGPVLALPFNEYRSFAWNRHRTILDPATRYLPAPVLTDDDLIVGTMHIAGENPQAAGVRALLDAGQPVTRTGLAWVLVERQAGGSIPAGALIGLKHIYSGESLDLYANPAAVAPPPVDTTRKWLLAGCYLVALVVFSWAVVSLSDDATPW